MFYWIHIFGGKLPFEKSMQDFLIHIFKEVKEVAPCHNGQLLYKLKSGIQNVIQI